MKKIIILLLCSIIVVNAFEAFRSTPSRSGKVVNGIVGYKWLKDYKDCYTLFSYVGDDNLITQSTIKNYFTLRMKNLINNIKVKDYGTME